MSTFSARTHGLLLWTVVAISCALLPGLANATFSIAACDPDGTCGVAVATHNLAVGASVPYARAGVGALAVQFETNPHYGPRGLALLADGATAQTTLDTLLAGDGDFDGTSVAERQVSVVSAKGPSATYTGQAVLRADWAGGVHGPHFAIQGNGLAGSRVIDAMQRTWQGASGPLGERLLRALEAGHAAGGQTIGAMSAALLVRTPEGDWQDIDLRVDGASRPLHDLRRLFDQRTAFDLVLRAEREARARDLAAARGSRDAALARAHDWDRIWRRAARLSVTMDDHAAALRCLERFGALNPVWAKHELDDPVYDGLRPNERFVALVRSLAKPGGTTE